MLTARSTAITPYTFCHIIRNHNEKINICHYIVITIRSHPYNLLPG